MGISLRAAALAALVTCVGTSAALADAYDGRWTVDFGESNGECAGVFRDEVTIAGSRVSYATGKATASGQVAASGAVTGTIVRPDSRVAVTGRLAGDIGGGTWKASGGMSCSGRWSARRG